MDAELKSLVKLSKTQGNYMMFLSFECAFKCVHGSRTVHKQFYNDLQLYTKELRPII